MHLRDLKTSGHAPSLLCAFLHFDISFMVWVILGALAPFIASDIALTGASLKVIPSSEVKAGQYSIVLKGADMAKKEASTVYHLLIKKSAEATKAGAKPVEKWTLDSANPATFAALNAGSNLIQIRDFEGIKSPNENVFPLKPAAVLAQEGKEAQVLANGMTAGQKGLLVAIPLLGSAFFRILFGFLSDKFGSKRVGVASLIATLLPLLGGWLFAKTYTDLLLVGTLLGIAGASFAIALPLASRWYPPHLQGLAMGIAGAGNSGTVLATLFAPLLAKSYGWHAVLGMLCIPVLAVLIIFTLFAKDAPGTAKKTSLQTYLSVLKQRDTYAFCILYFVTFGGFVGLSSFLNTFFVDQYGVAKATVGIVTAPFIVAGSLLRPIGGGLADRFGGIRMLTLLYLGAFLSLIGVGFQITNQAVVSVLLFIGMGCLGMGNGSVFQLIPQRFRAEIGAITGLVGAIGGVGGFYLNVLLGNLKDATGAYASGFWAFSATTLVAVCILRFVARAWTEWLGEGGTALVSGATAVQETPTLTPNVVPENA
jgi:NNP family nitrate/nitrite transporter-like MFS transporter